VLAVVEKLALALGVTMAKFVGEVERAKLPASKSAKRHDAEN